jgi:hypothetical protein
MLGREKRNKRNITATGIQTNIKGVNNNSGACLLVLGCSLENKSYITEQGFSTNIS